MLIPVILSGGSGSRLWPISREAFPKQLHKFASEHTLLQDTALRASKLCDSAAPLVISNQQHRFLVNEQLAEVGIIPSHIILEPIGRNTAPAVAIAALQAMAINKDAIIWIMPADHRISQIDKLQQPLSTAINQAEQNKLVTFGIKPNFAATGYGYIQQGQQLDANSYQVAKFIEKPNQANAEQLITQGDVLWNSGMFVFKAETYLAELAKHAPAMLDACTNAFNGRQQDLNFVVLDEQHFAACPSDSIDYAVMEKTSGAAVVPLDCDWCDLGAWPAIAEISKQDANQNTTIGDVLTHDTNNCYLHSSNKLISTVGLKDCVVVETADAVLVADKNHCQDVKQIVNQLKATERPEAETHQRVYRPWGFYEVLCQGEKFQVKRILVKPGAKLSLQSHQHRSEHWVVVTGVADVVRGDETLQLRANQSTYIPVGAKHRLANNSDEILEVIETQSGDYLGEDDIVRYEDIYARN